MAKSLESRLEELQKYLHYNALVLWRTRDFWVRAILCWTIGAVLLVNDEVTNFDVRLKARGPRLSKAPIVLVNLPERDWSSLENEINVLRPLKEVVTYTDAYFWNARSWERLLAKILQTGPRAVGVTMFFGENVRAPRITDSSRALFEDPRVIWGAEMDNSGRMLVPLFSSTYNTNVGFRGQRLDDDGTVRRFSRTTLPVPHLALRVAARAEPSLSPDLERSRATTTIINYAGDSSAFTVVNARDVVEARIPPEFFKGKIVIVGSLESPVEQVQTPLGRMSRAEVTANIVDNIINDRSITRLPTPIYMATLGLMIAAAIWVLITYPQSVTLVVFLLASILWISGSIWFFDRTYVWVPVFSPLLQLIATCIVFLSYQLAQNEKRTWRLQQEQHYLQEIEQLKTNFVSMMSHDLKTPIAKIQAICDRLIAAVQESEIATDLKTLRKSSDELHRYIQSILQITKVEAKDFRIRKEPMDINENIEKVIARLMPLAREKGVALETRLEPMFSIEADSTLIQEVILNLVENAIKYTPTSGRIAIISEEKDDNVMVVVEDTGPGIDPEDQKDIWRKFTRGRNQVTAGGEVRGTGLGLYLVKYFIELHGGQVFLESKPGQGTRIGFSVPIADLQELKENDELAAAADETEKKRVEM